MNYIVLFCYMQKVILVIDFVWITKLSDNSYVKLFDMCQILTNHFKMPTSNALSDKVIPSNNSYQEKYTHINAF